MVDRFRAHGLLDHVSFISAVPRGSSVVISMLASGFNATETTRARVACFVSHLEAMKQGLKDSPDQPFIICEDDLLFHNALVPRMREILADWTPGISHGSVLRLAYQQFRMEQDFTWRNSNDRLRRYGHVGLGGWHLNFGAQMYLLGPEVARLFISAFDRPGVLGLLCGGHMTAFDVWLETFPPGGSVYARPSLAIEELVDSQIQQADLWLREMAMRVYFYRLWAYTDYEQSDIAGNAALRFLRPLAGGFYRYSGRSLCAKPMPLGQPVTSTLIPRILHLVGANAEEQQAWASLLPAWQIRSILADQPSTLAVSLAQVCLEALDAAGGVCVISHALQPLNLEALWHEQPFFSVMLADEPPELHRKTELHRLLAFAPGNAWVKRALARLALYKELRVSGPCALCATASVTDSVALVLPADAFP